MLELMLQKDVDRRPTAAKCLAQPWFQAEEGGHPTLSVGVVQCLELYSRLPEFKKAVFMLMAHQSAAPAIRELHAIFTHFDHGNHGTLASSDLRGLLGDCGMKP